MTRLALVSRGFMLQTHTQACIAFNRPCLLRGTHTAIEGAISGGSLLYSWRWMQVSGRAKDELDTCIPWGLIHCRPACSQLEDFAHCASMWDAHARTPNLAAATLKWGP